MTASVSCERYQTKSLVNRVAGFSFFFSSRRRHTRCSRDWSSDVCSSDLAQEPAPEEEAARPPGVHGSGVTLVHTFKVGRLTCHTLDGGRQHLDGGAMFRSEERRVGKECRSRWSPYH